MILARQSQDICKLDHVALLVNAIALIAEFALAPLNAADDGRGYVAGWQNLQPVGARSAMARPSKRQPLVAPGAV